MKADLVVVGGGAAGMMCAGTAAEAGVRVLLLEPNDKLGRKLRITGKGRCNCTNNCDTRGFMANVPTNPKFLYSCLNAFPPERTMAFFESIGVALKTERGNRVFPVSDSANELADALGAWLHGLGVRVVKTRAREILTENGAASGVWTDAGVISCRAAALCTGGRSYPITGSRGDGYGMAERLGHHIMAQRPSLVPLESPDEFCAELAGFAPRNVTLRVYEDGRLIFEELGEMLFTHFGVSGPLVLSASALMRRFGECRYALAIDFKPGLDAEKLDERLLRDFAKYANRNFANALDELAARSFIPVLIRQSGIAPEQKVNSITREQRHRLGALFKAFPVRVSAARPIDEAIVTSGGVDVREVEPRTMRSKLVSGLYFAGELLDVDAYTGGFNLQIAWSTGHCAGRNIGETYCYE